MGDSKAATSVRRPLVKARALAKVQPLVKARALAKARASASDRKHGLVELAHENGHVAYRAEYHNGRLHGLVESWSPGGRCTSCEYFKNGKRLPDDVFYSMQLYHGQKIARFAKFRIPEFGLIVAEYAGLPPD